MLVKSNSALVLQGPAQYRMGRPYPRTHLMGIKLLVFLIPSFCFQSPLPRTFSHRENCAWRAERRAGKAEANEVYVDQGFGVMRSWLVRLDNCSTRPVHTGSPHCWDGCYLLPCPVAQTAFLTRRLLASLPSGKPTALKNAFTSPFAHKHSFSVDIRICCS